MIDTMRRGSNGAGMNLGLIDAFSAVMKTGSTTRAAELLRVSQPAISRALKRMEDTTKLKLFERNGPRLAPTPEAHEFYREIVATHVGLDHLRQAVARIRTAGTGSLRLGSSAALGISFLPRVLHKFLLVWTDLSVAFEIANSLSVRNLVAAGTYDIGLCADEIDRSNLIVHPFITTRAICVMRADHPLTSEALIKPGMLDGVPVVSLFPGDTARKQFESAFESAGAVPKMVVETQFGTTICQLALEGVGVGLTNSLAYVTGGFEDLGLIARPFVPAVAFRTLLILPPHRARSKVVDELIVLLEHERDLLEKRCQQAFGESDI